MSCLVLNILQTRLFLLRRRKPQAEMPRSQLWALVETAKLKTHGSSGVWRIMQPHCSWNIECCGEVTISIPRREGQASWFKRQDQLGEGDRQILQPLGPDKLLQSVEVSSLPGHTEVHHIARGPALSG